MGSILLFAVSFLAYAQTIGYEFVQDDAIVITENEFTTQGIAGVPALLKYDTFRGFFKTEGKDKLVAGGRYRPLTPVFFAIGISIFGESPVWGHLFNCLFYAGVVVLLYHVLLVLLAGKSAGSPKRKAAFIALSASLLFATHPLHTEVVANIKGLDEIFVLGFALLAWWFTLRAHYYGGVINHVFVFVAFLLAFLSKENTITLVPLIPLSLWFFADAKWKTVFLSSIPYLAATVVFLVIRSSVVGISVGGTTMELMNNPFLKYVNDALVPFTGSEKAASILVSLGKYLQLLVAPFSLTHDYYPRQIGVVSFSDWRALLSLVAYLGMTVLAILKWKRGSFLTFGILWYLATLSIASNIVFPIGTNLSERFAFLPSVGFCLVVAYAFAKWSDLKTNLPKGLIATLAISGLFFVLTVMRNPAWKSNSTLFLTDVEKSSNSAKLNTAAGGELIARSILPENESQKMELLRKAEGYLRKAIEIHPLYKSPWLLLGNAATYAENYDAAIQSYERALALDDEFSDARNNLVIALINGARMAGEKQGDINKAVQMLQRAVSIDPTRYEAFRLLGVASGNSGQHAQAADYFMKAKNLKPDEAAAWINLAMATANAGNLEQAQQYQAKALELDPEVLNKMRQ